MKFLLSLLILLGGMMSLEAKINTNGTYKILKTDTDAVRIPFKMHNNKPVMDLEINGKKSCIND